MMYKFLTPEMTGEWITAPDTHPYQGFKMFTAAAAYVCATSEQLWEVEGRDLIVEYYEHRIYNEMRTVRQLNWDATIAEQWVIAVAEHVIKDHAQAQDILCQRKAGGDTYMMRLKSRERYADFDYNRVLSLVLGGPENIAENMMCVEHEFANDKLWELVNETV